MKRSRFFAILVSVGLIAVLSIAACTPILAPASAGPSSTTVTVEDVSAAYQAVIQEAGNLTYGGIYTDSVTLVDGAYAGAPFVEGGESKPTVTLIPSPMAFGDLNGDGQDDAALLLAENSGGSGTFVYLAAVTDPSDPAAVVPTILLGDRVQVQTLSIENGVIHATWLGFTATDPMCCPSEKVSKSYALQDGQLVEVAS